MIHEELKKLYIKQFGLILTLMLIVGEIFFVNYLYPKRQFTSEITERHFYEYMDNFSGKLTSEREGMILIEQERIVDARNRASAIERRLYNGEYTNEEAFVAEYEENRLITERKEAFDLIFEQYSYALEAPNERYLTIGDYSGMTADFPDVLLLVLVIFVTAILFLNEESSGVITFVRICTNGKQKTLYGKLTAISVFILSAQFFRMVLEFFVMISRGNIRELSYPIQTLEFFQNSPYDISILQGFLIISALRLLGYLFIAAFIILLSVTLRRALFTIFIPSVVCLLQQFAFNPVTPAYYIPTGFLRGVGYLRGNLTTTNYLGDEIKIFTEISFALLISLEVATSAFIVASVIIAYNYYAGKSFKLPQKALAVIAVITLCVMNSGCTQTHDESIKYNLWENKFFAQNDNNFYVSCNDRITQVSKIDSSELPLLYNLFSGERADYDTQIICDDNNIYFLGSSDIYKISLSDYGQEKVYSLNINGSPGFMDISIVEKPDLNINMGIRQGFFTDGKTYYYVYSSRILKNGKAIIDEKFYNSMVCCDGKKIYYINSLLQLKCYDIESGEITRLPGEFVRSIYFDGTRLLFSDKNGIFSLGSDGSTVKISTLTASRIASDGEKVVFLNDKKLYLLKDTPVEIYDGNFMTFAVISETNKLVIVQNNGEYELLDLLN